MSDASLAAPEAVCRELVAALSEVVKWEWDGRFGAAVAAFTAQHADAVGKALDSGFGASWAAGEIARAADRVQSLASRLGGLRAGQSLRTTSPEADAMLFCAWWPWGGGGRVSIRIGCDVAEGGDESIAAELPGWFGL